MNRKLILKSPIWCQSSPCVDKIWHPWLQVSGFPANRRHGSQLSGDMVSVTEGRASLTIDHQDKAQREVSNLYWGRGRQANLHTWPPYRRYYDAWMSGLTAKWVRLAPNGTYVGFFQIWFQYIFWRQNVLKYNLKNSRICPILGQSEQPWSRTWHHATTSMPLWYL